MRTVGLILAREYLTRVRTRTFLAATLGAPVILLGLLGFSLFLGARTGLGDQELILMDETGVLEEVLGPRLEALGFLVEPGALDEDPGIDLEGLPEERAGVAALFLDEETLARGLAVWRGERAPPPFRAAAVEQAIVQSVLEVRLDELDPGGQLAGLIGSQGGLQVEGWEDGGGGWAEREAGVVIGFGGAFLLYFVLMLYGTMVLRSVQEEKSNRIVEVLISSVRPWELMLGKILGVGAVGLTQLLTWLVLGGTLLILALPALLARLPEAPLPLEVGAFLPGTGLVALFLACFLSGYFLYAALFAVVGALCSSEEEAQQLQLPVVLVVLIPFLFLFPAMEDPDALWAVLLTLVPWFTPVLLFARAAVGTIPVWEGGLALALVAGALVLTARVAGVVYRVGILREGKRPRLAEIWRWVREG